MTFLKIYPGEGKKKDLHFSSGKNEIFSEKGVRGMIRNRNPTLLTKRKNIFI